MIAEPAIGSSFRDPSGRVVRDGGRVLRLVSSSYLPLLDRMEADGLYQALVDETLLIPHRRVPLPDHLREGSAACLLPELVQTISYPYEWCFGQYKEAALATLRIQKLALDHGMVLKDASAYNIQFHRGKALLIDTLSFELYEVGKPWRAYRQFCEHFVAPLALMANVDARLGKLMANFIDGVPLSLAAKMLPRKTRFNMGLFAHVHLHARAQAGGQTDRSGQSSFGQNAMRGLIDSLEGLIKGLKWEPKGTVWADYYNATNYSASAMEGKRAIVSELLDAIQPKPQVVWDLGANTGEFSKLASSRGIETVAWDFDEGAVERNYQANRSDARLLPLIVDLTNPSPAIGWAHEERESFAQRSNADVVMALALIHHLAIGNNVPLERIARFFADLSPWLIIEFVPKTDSQVQRLLSTRDDIYPHYTEDGFRQAFEQAYAVADRRPVSGSERAVYLMRRKG